MRLPFNPPIEPMLAKLSTDIPPGDGWLFEPKWDGFRAIVFRDGDETYIQSRDLKPLDRYFPELPPALKENLPPRCVVDGEIVIPSDDGLDFEALLLRIHPAESRVKMLAAQTPASFVAWDLLALGDDDLRGQPQGERRAAIEKAMAGVKPPVHLTPATHDQAVARDWFERFEGAGLDGVVAKPMAAAYQPGKRAMFKIKHARTADCVVAGFRWHKNGPGTHIGSLLLGLYDDAGSLHHVGITSSFSWERRAALVKELEPLRTSALDAHPWREWADWAGLGSADASGTRMPGATSRWNRGKDLSWEPLRNLYVSSAWPKLPTTTCRAIDSATPPRSSAGGLTSHRPTVATTSWKRPPPLSYSASSRPKQARSGSPRAPGASTLAPPHKGHVLQGGMNG